MATANAVTKRSQALGAQRAEVSKQTTYDWVALDKRGKRMKGRHAGEECFAGQGGAAPTGHESAVSAGTGEAAIWRNWKESKTSRCRDL